MGENNKETAEQKASAFAAQFSPSPSNASVVGRAGHDFPLSSNSFNSHPSTRLYVKGDKYRLRQVLANFVR